MNIYLMFRILGYDMAMRYERVDNTDEVVMPTRVVLITSGLYAAILTISELCLFAWRISSGAMLTAGHINVMAIITSAVALPAIGYFVYRSEDANASLRRLQRISRVDALTGLLNRRSFDEHVNAHIATSGLDHSAGTFLFIDVDNFKPVNDALGHVAGDRVLAAIGAVLQAGTDPNDVVGRIGGDEFGVFLPQASLEEGMKVAETLRRAVTQNCQLPELGDHSVSLSIGVAEHRAGTSLSECLRAADRQLYSAKHAGRDKVAGQSVRSRAAA